MCTYSIIINTQVKLDFLSLVLIKKEKFKKFNGFFKRVLYKLSYCSWTVIINKRLGGSNDVLTFHSSGERKRCWQDGYLFLACRWCVISVCPHMALVHERVLGQERGRLSLSLLPLLFSIGQQFYQIIVMLCCFHWSLIILIIKLNHLHTGPTSKQKHLAC